jgi:ferrous iron transport protein B
MRIKMALVGNPNCGKTTMFNALTGSSQYVGNWPGVTVEKKSGRLKGSKDVDIIDLPGIYSLSPYTLEEIITRNYLLNEKPDVIINIVDGTNLERNLYLTTQLIEIGIPVVLALNMNDIIKKSGVTIDIKKLSAKLSCHVFETSALKGDGLNELTQYAVALAKEKKLASSYLAYSNDVENTLSEISKILAETLTENLRYLSVKFFERDEKILEDYKINDNRIEKEIILCEKKLDDDSESIIITERYENISNIIRKCVKDQRTSKLTPSDKIDSIVTNRILALPIFGLIMFLVYYISVSSLGAWVTGWTNDILFGDVISSGVAGFLGSIGTAEWLNSLILDGIIGGVGAVLGFVPQLLILFFLLAILEDCGYMARVAFIMDRVFRKFGLSGKSFIPMLIGTGCSVPGIMASRTIENEADRRMTIITTSFIPCGAKLPIIALIAGALLNGAWWVAPSAYFLGIAAVICSGIILKKTRGFAGEVSPFVMELPNYRIPGLKSLLTHMWERGFAFIKKAGTIIFLSCGFIWFLSTFNTSMEMVETSQSMLASLGKIIAPIFIPLGFGNWESAVATFTGLIAKENVVGTFGVLFGFPEVAEDGIEIWSLIAANFTVLSAYTFLVFNLLCAPCFAAIGAIKQEMGSMKWTCFAVGYQTLFAYSVTLIMYQLGLLFTGNGFGFGTFVAIVLFSIFIYLLFRKSTVVDNRNLSSQKIAQVE